MVDVSMGPVVIAVSVVVFLVLLGLAYSRLYVKATPERSFVKTGVGGLKVIKDGGAMVLPIIHDCTFVNMKTIKLVVSRREEEALLTKEGMRADVEVEFYVRVLKNEKGITAAAQSMGTKTMDANALKEHIQGKFIDALRAVASSMTINDLHQQRKEFVQNVTNMIAADLEKSGMELETASLTKMDQTDRKYFRPENAFDASGLTYLTKQTEMRRKERNEIEQTTRLEIEHKNLETERESLSIAQEQEQAKLNQTKVLEVDRARQVQEIAEQQAMFNRQSQEAEILATKGVKTAQIESDNAVLAQEIERAKEIEKAEIEKAKTLEAARIEKEREIEEAEIRKAEALESSKIAKEKLVGEAEIAKRKAIETATILKNKEIELSKQLQDIEVAEKSKQLSEARAEAEKARALAVEAEERVETAKEKERANRLKEIDLIEASKIAETQAVSVRVAAEAEKMAAEDLAEARRIEAKGKSDQTLLVAKAEAEAETLRAEAKEAYYEAEAEGKRKLNEAANALSDKQIELEIRKHMIDKLPEILNATMKPIEKIDSIRLVKFDGAGMASMPGNSGSDGKQSSGSGGGSLASEMVDAALRHRSLAPFVDSITKEMGLNLSSEEGIAQSLANLASLPRKDEAKTAT